MRMWFRPVKGIAFCIVAAFFGTGEKEFSFSETYFGI